MHLVPGRLLLVPVVQNPDSSKLGRHSKYKKVVLSDNDLAFFQKIANSDFRQLKLSENWSCLHPDFCAFWISLYNKRPKYKRSDFGRLANCRLPNGLVFERHPKFKRFGLDLGHSVG